MWGLIRLTSLNWCCVKTHIHTHACMNAHIHTPSNKMHNFQPHLAGHPRASTVINVSVIQVPGSGGCRQDLRARLRGLTLAEGEWVMSAPAFPQRGWRRADEDGEKVWLGPQAAVLGERSPLSLVWLIRHGAQRSPTALSISVATRLAGQPPAATHATRSPSDFRSQI